MQLFRLALCLAAGVLAFAPAATAQVLYGSLVGSVEDPSSASVVGATVTVKSDAIGVTREAQTDSTGRFTVNNLIPGVYDVTIKAEGFRTVTRSGVEITANNIVRADLKLEVGNVSESVTVSAQSAALQTETASVSNNINEKAITQMPLPAYRNYQALLNLIPGTTPAATQNAQIDSPARALTTNVNGTNRNNNNTRLDGATNVFIWLPHHTVYVAPSETIEQVNITTNAMDAEQGMAGGAAVTVTTKSGTNELHGVLFHYHDNQRLRARNFFLPSTREKPVSITNIPGGTLGGPIVKNKLFFFGGYEGFVERIGFFAINDLPAMDLRNGDFSRLLNDPAQRTVLYDPLTGNPDGSGRRPFENNVIPSSRISPIARQMLSRLPAPNLAGRDFQNHVATSMPGMNRHNFDGKINWNRSQNHTIWGKYSHMDALVRCDYAFGDGGGPPLCSGGPGTGDTVVKLTTMGHTYTLSPTMILDGTFGYTRMDQVVTTPDYGQNIGLELGIPGTNGPDERQSGLPGFLSTGFTNFGNTNGWQPAFRNDYSYTGTTNVGWVKGSHDMRFGVDVVRHALNHWQPELDNPRGRFTFANGITGLNEPGAPTLRPFNAFGAFLLGMPNEMGKSLQHLLMTTREWQWGLYFRDRWQVSRALTLNLGLRWEFYPTMGRDGRGLERYDLATNRVLIGGFGGNPDNAGVTSSKKLFAPRIGIAYRLGDNTVIRTGYGLTYNPLPVSRPLRGEYPSTVAQNFLAPNSFTAFRPIEQGIPEFTGPDITSGSVELPRTVSERTPYSGQLNRGYIQSWNFTVERKLPGGFTGNAGYVGNLTVRQFADNEINAAGPGGGNAGRPLALSMNRLVSTRYWDGWLGANYHALQTQLNKLFGGGALIRFAYTYSKAINMTDDDGWAGLTFNWSPMLSRNRALAGYDRTHSAVVGFVYELPFGQGKRFANGGGALGWLIGGWQASGTQVYYSGSPFTVTGDAAGVDAPGNTQTADQTGEVRLLDGIGVGNPYYDPSAWRAVPSGSRRFGTSGRNSVRGPGHYQLNASLNKTMRFGERWNLQLRAEGFNVTNTPIFANPNANANSPQFMNITSTRADIHQDRQFRFGLRLAF